MESGAHYPKPNHLQPAVVGLFPYIPKLPNMENAVKEILSLPIHGEMSLDVADKVADAIAEFYGKK
ncbi:MAG TPA: DegT/DnrJ/EryC1/StrS family aminotransferase [Verrucomicrobiae bacterium]|nr:DegT/DnrJ/EryC1/StrS family aminotransferase [Verrucomicrobiae bacterium]